MDPTRRKKLIRLAILSAVIDLVATFAEIPFLEFMVGTIAVKEIIEQLISTLIARHEINLTAFDRLVGLIPFPGVTPVTVRVARALLTKKS